MMHHLADLSTDVKPETHGNAQQESPQYMAIPIEHLHLSLTTLPCRSRSLIGHCVVHLIGSGCKPLGHPSHFVELAQSKWCGGCTRAKRLRRLGLRSFKAATERQRGQLQFHTADDVDRRVVEAPNPEDAAAVLASALRCCRSRSRCCQASPRRPSSGP